MVQSEWGSGIELTNKADVEQRRAVLERKALPSATPLLSSTQRIRIRRDKKHQSRFDSGPIVSQVYQYQTETGDGMTTEANDRLTAWLINPGHVIDDGLESPSYESIRSALRLVGRLFKQEKELPQQVVMDGEGGITMDDGMTMDDCGEWKIVQYDIDRDGQVERLVFEDSRLVSREEVELKQKPETDF